MVSVATRDRKKSESITPVRSRPAKEVSPATYANARLVRGKLFAGLGQYARAIDDFEEASRLQPRSASLHNDMAWFLATFPDTEFQQPELATILAEKAVELDADNGSFLTSPRWTAPGVSERVRKPTHSPFGEKKGASV